MRIGGVVNLLNKQLAGRRYALMGPGRWGSNDINLGVRVTYSNINRTKLLVEIAFAKEGGTPEVSYGTHFFQDLVEADITVASIFPDDPGAFFDEQFILQAENLLGMMASEYQDCANVVRVINVPAARDGDLLHVYLDGATRKGLGFFGPPGPIQLWGATIPSSSCRMIRRLVHASASSTAQIWTQMSRSRSRRGVRKRCGFVMVRNSNSSASTASPARGSRNSGRR